MDKIVAFALGFAIGALATKVYSMMFPNKK